MFIIILLIMTGIWAEAGGQTDGTDTATVTAPLPFFQPLRQRQLARRRGRRSGAATLRSKSGRVAAIDAVDAYDAAAAAAALAAAR